MKFRKKIIVKYGYPLEVHDVVGWNNMISNHNRSVFLITHGLLCSSATGPEKLSIKFVNPWSKQDYDIFLFSGLVLLFPVPLCRYL